MKRLVAASVLILLSPSLVLGLDTVEPYIEAFLASLPHGITYWTRSGAAYGGPHRSFATARIVHEDGGTQYFLQESGLVVVKPLPASEHRRIFTHHFYFLHMGEAPLAVYDPSGREIACFVTGGPATPSQAALQQLQESVSVFSDLTLRYGSLYAQELDYSGIWVQLGFSLLMAGMTVWAATGAANAEDSLDRLAALGCAGGFGLMTALVGGLAIGEVASHRGRVREMRDITSRMEAMISAGPGR